MEPGYPLDLDSLSSDKACMEVAEQVSMLLGPETARGRAHSMTTVPVHGPPLPSSPSASGPPRWRAQGRRVCWGEKCCRGEPPPGLQQMVPMMRMSELLP